MRRAGLCVIAVLLLTAYLGAGPAATPEEQEELEVRERILSELCDAGTSALDLAAGLLARGRRPDAVKALEDCVHISEAIILAAASHVAMVDRGTRIPRGLSEFSKGMKELERMLEEGGAPTRHEKGGGSIVRLREVWDSLVAAALGQIELARFLLHAGKSDAGEKAIQRLDGILGVLKRWAWRVETGIAARKEVVKSHVEAGRFDEARSGLTELDRLMLLAKEAQTRLAGLAELRGGIEKSVEPDPEPEEEASLRSSFYGGRATHRRLFRNGGGASTELAVEMGLSWLAKHQDEDGFWDCDSFMREDIVAPICDGAGNPLYDPGVSGLAILAFLGAGHDPLNGAHKAPVERGLTYLKMVQDPEGCFGPRSATHFTYNHAVATRAMVEAWAMTGSVRYRESAQRGVDFIEACQNPYLAWRYGVRPQDNDTSVSGWMFCALKAAQAAGILIAPGAYDGMQAWIDKATEPEFGRVGYTSRGTGPARPQDLMDQFPADKSESLTSVGILCRVFLGQDPKENYSIRKGTELCLKALPEWDEQSGAIDMYYWYYGTEAMFQVGGDAWIKWNRALKHALLPNQRRDGAFRGSWDPVGPWGAEGGRVYSTALCVLALETYYRTGRRFE